MTKHAIKPGTQLCRAFSVARETIDEQARTAELAFASETPYERIWGIEILDCTPEAMRMGRLTSGGPLLCDHDTKDQIGVIEDVQIGADRVCRATVRFGRSARASEIFQDVLDGIRRNVSVGYQIHDATLVQTRSADGPETYRVTDWEPLEVSMVSVPADATVGIGRSDSPIEQIEQIKPILKEETMTTDTTIQAPALTSQDVRNAEAAARKAMTEMMALGDTHERFNGRALAKSAIEKGQSIDELRSHIMNAMTAAQTSPATNLDLSRGDQKRFSVFKAIRALTDKNWKGAEFELECHAEILKRTGLQEAVHGGFFMPVDIQRRDLTVGTASAGGNLVGTDLQPQSFIDILRARSRAAQLGMTMLTGLVGNVAVPKLTGSATAYWLANEATAITESSHTFGQLALAPKTLGAYTELSRLLMLQSTPAAEALVMGDFAKVLALAIDLAVFEGSSASGQPTGISQTNGIGSVTGTSIDLPKIVEFQSDLADANALADGCAYITTPAIAGVLKGRARLASTDSQTLWTGSLLDGTIDGMRAVTSTQLTAGSMIFGDFSQVVLGEWGMLEIALNPYASFATALTGIRAIQTVDVGIRQAAAFSRATSIT